MSWSLNYLHNTGIIWRNWHMKKGRLSWLRDYRHSILLWMMKTMSKTIPVTQYCDIFTEFLFYFWNKVFFKFFVHHFHHLLDYHSDDVKILEVIFMEINFSFDLTLDSDIHMINLSFQVSGHRFCLFVGFEPYCLS